MARGPAVKVTSGREEATISGSFRYPPRERPGGEAGNPRPGHVIVEPLRLPTCSVHDTLAERGSSAGGGDGETPISRACCRRAVRTSRS